MPEQGSEAVGIGAVATQLKTRLETLARLQGELALRKAQKAMIGGGIALVGIILLALSLLAGLAAIAAGIATVLEPWLAILILFGGLVIVGLTLIAVGIALVKRGKRAAGEPASEPLTAPAGSDDNG